MADEPVPDSPFPVDSSVALNRMLQTSGLSKNAFARAAGMDLSALNKYLNPDGPKMSTSTLLRVADATGFDAFLTIRPKFRRRLKRSFRFEDVPDWVSEVQLTPVHR